MGDAGICLFIYLPRNILRLWSISCVWEISSCDDSLSCDEVLCLNESNFAFLKLNSLDGVFGNDETTIGFYWVTDSD